MFIVNFFFIFSASSPLPAWHGDVAIWSARRQRAGPELPADVAGHPPVSPAPAQRSLHTASTASPMYVHAVMHYQLWIYECLR